MQKRVGEQVGLRWGHAPLALDDIKIGDTRVEDFDERGTAPGGSMALPTSMQKRPGETVVDLDEARHDLREAEIEHDGAAQELEAARSKETAARNRLNQAQKRFDAAVETIKARAPRDSDWGRDRTSRSGSVD